MTAKIRLSGVTKSFGPKVVLDGVDLAVAAGESVVVIGGSGVGKSVLLKCILGLVTPNRGSIEVDGTEVVGWAQEPETKPCANSACCFKVRHFSTVSAFGKTSPLV